MRACVHNTGAQRPRGQSSMCIVIYKTDTGSYTNVLDRMVASFSYCFLFWIKTHRNVSSVLPTPQRRWRTALQS